MSVNRSFEQPCGASESVNVLYALSVENHGSGNSKNIFAHASVTSAMLCTDLREFSTQNRTKIEKTYG